MALAATVVLASCSESENVLVNDGDVEIALRSTTMNASGVATRTPFEGAIGTTNQLVARVVTSTTANFLGSPYANGTMTFKGAGAVSYDAGATGTTTFPDATNSVYLFGLYPSTWTVSNGGQATYTFTGKEDAMATQKVATKRSDVVASTYQVLNFEHLLTRLEVKLSAADAAAAIIGDIASVKLVGNRTSTTPIEDQVTILNNADEMVVSFAPGANNTLDFYGLTEDADGEKVYSDITMADYALTTDAELVAYSMVAPVTASEANKEEYILEIATELDGSKYIGIDLMAAAGEAFVGNTAGKSFTISLYFKSNEQIMVDVTVEDWEEEGEWQGEVAVD